MTNGAHQIAELRIFRKVFRQPLSLNDTRLVIVRPDIDIFPAVGSGVHTHHRNTGCIRGLDCRSQCVYIPRPKHNRLNLGIDKLIDVGELNVHIALGVENLQLDFVLVFLAVFHHALIQDAVKNVACILQRNANQNLFLSIARSLVFASAAGIRRSTSAA